MSSARVSVVIPVYNVAPYLARCLDSVLAQSLGDFEVLCVDDASTDGSLEVLEGYASREPRVRIVGRTANGGLSAARNDGLDRATGRYVQFVDSDDWIDPGFLERAVAVASGSAAPVVTNLSVVNEGGPGEDWNPERYGDFAVLSRVQAVNGTPCMACTSLHETAYLRAHGFRFPEGLVHEDVYFRHATLSAVERVPVFAGPAYHYRIRRDGIMGSRTDPFGDYCRISDRILAFYARNPAAAVGVDVLDGWRLDRVQPPPPRGQLRAHPQGVPIRRLRRAAARPGPRAAAGRKEPVRARRAGASA